MYYIIELQKVNLTLVLMVKICLSMQETLIPGSEDSLVEEMATHSMQKSLVGYSPWDHKELDTPEPTYAYTYIHT